ncbi:DNA repair protein RecO [Rarobacter faecitabidus]|uniref:DNA repair protein RecO n=1 Tax=Rarobacter faecitabidus TaxID=13243 RepID=A0A542ZV40_RARFA|nr:DNA repair protein RecO [Rarobacter faecitabidus]TQL64181.1 DNA replication and repair protein RecO [Rarobacter faecitabidus]
MPLFRDEAIVLRTHKLGESDRIVTMLTRERGKTRAVARGVRKTGSKYGARVEPFMHVDVQTFQGRSLDTITQVETLDALARGICEDYALFTAGTTMLEAAGRIVAAEHEPAIQQYWLLLGGLKTLARGDHSARSVLDSYLLRSIAIAGYAPSFDECARCGAPGPHRAFSAQWGGAVCSNCRPPGSAAPAPEVMSLLGALLAGEWDVIDTATERSSKDASGLVAAFSQFHLERSLRSLPFVEQNWPLSQPTLEAGSA